MKRILLSIVLLASMSKLQLINRIIEQERALSESLQALNDKVSKEKNLIDGIDAQIDAVFEK